jgi:hypothetical protein
MKIKIRPDDATTLQADDWLQTNDWLAELRNDDRAEPPAPGDDRAEPPYDSTRPEVSARPVTAAPARPVTSAAPASPATSAAPASPATSAARDSPAGPPGASVRAVIGDQLRIPIMWCEMGCCISWFSDPAALGEGDARARAIGADWRIDALGRLACPRCQQTDRDFRASRPVVPWDRYTAIVAAARATRLPLLRGD